MGLVYLVQAGIPVICRTCGIRLPGHVTHSEPSDCISALRGRLTIRESALTEARRVSSRRRDSISDRVEALEAQLETMAGRMAKFDDVCQRALQRSHFAVQQTARRAS